MKKRILGFAIAAVALLSPSVGSAQIANPPAYDYVTPSYGGTPTTDIDLNETYKIIFDADEDSYMIPDGDDSIDFYAGGQLMFTMGPFDLFLRRNPGNFNWGSDTFLTSVTWRWNLSTDELLLHLNDEYGNQFIISGEDGYLSDHDHLLQANPTLFIHSDTDPDIDNTQWISFTHDQTDGVITTGAGSVRFDSNIDLNGASDIIVDADADTYLTSSAIDDRISIFSGAIETLRVNAGVPTLPNTVNSFGWGGATAGTAGNLIWRWNSAQVQFQLGLDDAFGNHMVIGNAANVLKDYDHALTTNPTLYIHSDVDPDTNNTQWLSLTHDQTDGVITTGLGSVRFDSDIDLNGASNLIVDADADSYITSDADDTINMYSASTELFRISLPMVGAVRATGNFTMGGSVYTGAGNPSFRWDSTSDELKLLTDDAFGNQFVIGNAAYVLDDFDHALQTNPTLYIHSDTDPDTNNTQWISLTHNQTDGFIDVGTGQLSTTSTGRKMAIKTVTNAASPYTIGGGDEHILCDATSGNVTINLPASSVMGGRHLWVKKIDASANSCTIDGNASETIDGATTQSTTTQYDTWSIINDGSAWYIR